MIRKIRLRTLAIYALACLSGIVLLYTSQKVQQAEERLQAVENAAQNEQETIRVLKAEWAYLNNPERLEALASDFLALEPPQPSQIISEPSSLPVPEMLSEFEGDGLYREISHEPQAEAEPAPAAVVPQKKPSVPGARIKKEKSFDALLGELESGGAQ